MSVRVIDDENHFQAELSAAGIRLVVVDFTASWYVCAESQWLSDFSRLHCVRSFRCGPCQRIAPLFEQFPTKYPRAIFLKVDVDKCQDTAASQGVSAMPTFIFYRNKVTKIKFIGRRTMTEHFNDAFLFNSRRSTESKVPMLRCWNRKLYSTSVRQPKIRARIMAKVL